jgi:hypothetical protein
MFDATITYSHDSDPTPGTKTFTGIDRNALCDLQDIVLGVAKKMNDSSRQRMKAPGAPGVSGTLKYEMVITNDGADGGGSTMRTPNIDANQYQWVKGVFDGALSKHKGKSGK